MSQKLVETLTSSDRTLPKECLVCIICHRDLLVGGRDPNPAVALNCGHVFHKLCVTRWTKFKASCPKCRKYVDPKKPGSQLFFDQGYEDDAYSTAEEDEEGKMQNSKKYQTTKNRRVVNDEVHRHGSQSWSNSVGLSTTTTTSSNSGLSQNNSSGQSTGLAGMWNYFTTGGGGSGGQQAQDDRLQNIGATIVTGVATGLAIWYLGSLLPIKVKRR